jgi:hypothetical protein
MELQGVDTITPRGRQSQHTRIDVAKFRQHEMATLGEQVGVDLWNYRSDDGRSIRRALDWLLPFATGEQEWTHEQLKGLDPERLTPFLRRAAIVWQEPAYERAARKLGSDADDQMHLLWPERY